MIKNEEIKSIIFCFIYIKRKMLLMLTKLFVRCMMKIL